MTTTKKKASVNREKKNEEFQVKIETFGDLYIFRDGLLKVERKGRDFSYAVNRNLRLINEEIKDLEKMREHTPEMKEYLRKVEELNKECAIKDDEGEFIYRDGIIQGQRAKMYRIPGKNDPNSYYSKQLKKYKSQFAKTIKEQEEREQQWKEMLEKPCSYEPYMVEFRDVPDAAAPQMDQLMYMIHKKD